MPTSTTRGIVSTVPAPLMPLLLTLVVFAAQPAHTSAQTSTFTYQGQLTDGVTVANGSFDLQFALFGNAAGGAQIGATQTVPAVAVDAGLFTVQLDFGTNAFPGANRFLEIGVRPAGGGSYTTLTPRQPISSTPYAIRCLNAGSADSVAVAGVPAGSSSYIQNTNSPQAGTNFNISGSGTVGGTLTGNVVAAATQFNLGGNRVLSVTGAGTFPNSNTFAGVAAGASNAPDSDGLGTLNSFFGADAGKANTTGANNSFFGNSAGASNTTANFNSFFGSDAGRNNSGPQNAFFGNNAGESNTTAGFNSFFGNDAGRSTTEGGQNAFFGEKAGEANTTGGFNSFFGQGAGGSNVTGFNNAFVGQTAGGSNTTGTFNAFLGTNAGYGITTGSSNTFVGNLAGGFADSSLTGDRNTLLGAGTNVALGVSNATAIGSQAHVTQSNALVLGRISGVNGANANTNVGIGTTAPLARLHVVGDANGQALMATLGSPVCPGSYAVGGCSTNQEGVYGRSTSYRGVQGFSSTGVGVAGNSDAQGVAGIHRGAPCDGAFGVGGCSTNQTGVFGRSDTGIGVLGDSTTRGVVGTLGQNSCPGTYAVGGCTGDATGSGVHGQSNTGTGVRASTTSGQIFTGDGGGTQRVRIDATGRGFFNGGTQMGGADYADSMRTTQDLAELEPGDVLAIDPQHGDAVRQSREPNSRLVAGVYSTQPSILGVGKHGVDDSLTGEVPVALLGIVPTKVTAENGPIQSGDLLVTSSLPGRAMKARPDVLNGVAVYPTGAILGKALEPLREGAGVIKVLVTLR